MDMPDPKTRLQLVKRAQEIFGPDARVYYGQECENVAYVLITLRPGHAWSSFELTTRGTDMMNAVVDMQQVLGRICMAYPMPVAAPLPTEPAVAYNDNTTNDQ
jgi:hypothetical protein